MLSGLFAAIAALVLLAGLPVGPARAMDCASHAGTTVEAAPTGKAAVHHLRVRPESAPQKPQNTCCMTTCIACLGVVDALPLIAGRQPARAEPVLSRIQELAGLAPAPDHGPPRQAI